MTESMQARLEVHFHPRLGTRTDAVTVRDPILGVEETFEISDVRAKDDRADLAVVAKRRFVEKYG